MIDRAQKSDGLLMEFLPTPKPLLETMAGSYGDSEKQQALELQQLENIRLFGAKDWYDWNVANWGTKWDFNLENVERVDEHTLTAAFDSAWAPPIDAYVKLLALGFVIEALYYEPGMAFCGRFVGDENDYADDYYEFSGHDSTTVREAVGEDIDDYFGISDEMAQYEEENEESENE
jgi:hypothetical protein